MPTILVIFGISGDLSKRYLLPSLEKIVRAKMLPKNFKIVGVTRQKHPDLYVMDLTDKKDYEKLNDYLSEIEKKFKKPAQRLFYLVVPPNACKNIITLIGQSSLNKHKNNKILLEKPFGTNLKSAIELIKHTDKYFKAKDVYRIDHYLAKDEIKQIILERNKKSFKAAWNNKFIEKIEILASEKIGIEGRVHFYEQTGALRDFVQSHLLELLALVLMKLPKDKKENVPSLRYKALKDLDIVCDVTKYECVKRGQYEGYRQEAGNPKSMTETFVFIKLSSSDKRWQGVPITLVTGKNLKEKFTKVKIKHQNGLIEFDFKDKENVLGAYEQVLLAAINGDRNFFTSSAEVLESWRILEEVQNSWKNSKDDLIIYKKGSTIEEVSKNNTCPVVNF
ncbi:MAG: hypothetical protein Q7K54_03415 [Candidatus Parcubacteria bacterium]|nr:hypothetical protein [Candidatus Parcubacteria bacterium]